VPCVVGYFGDILKDVRFIDVLSSNKKIQSTKCSLIIRVFEKIKNNNQREGYTKGFPFSLCPFLGCGYGEKKIVFW
jgi:hypothetical protein